MDRYMFGGSSGGMQSQMATQWPLFGKGHPVHFWAERGLVKYRDEDPECPEHKRHGAMDWRIAAKRTIAISEMIVNSNEDGHYSDERIKLQQFVTEMENVIRRAKEQGGPNDGAAVHRNYKRARPVSVVVPTIVDLD